MPAPKRKGTDKCIECGGPAKHYWRKAWRCDVHLNSDMEPLSAVQFLQLGSSQSNYDDIEPLGIKLADVMEMAAKMQKIAGVKFIYRGYTGGISTRETNQ